MKSAAIDVTTFSEARANLKSVMDKVVNDHRPMIISRRKAEPVVMMSLADWNSWQETTYLRSSPDNARRLDRAVTELNAGKPSIRTEWDGEQPVRTDATD